ncbi:MAG TPA: hydrogenase nickel incorporation protein HypB [bacterium]
MKKITVLKPILVSNSERAKENRKFFDRSGSLVVNIIASPGAGKTSIIEAIGRRLKKDYRILVIEGDIKGSLDSSRIKRLGIDTIQINTETQCHLDAFMTAQVLARIKKHYDLILVENVGNLVCPAEFEIGEDFKMAILSTPEGDDKPLKYPLVFHVARAIVINKCDLLKHVDFSLAKARKAIKQCNPRGLLFEVSAKTGAGFAPLTRFLISRMQARKPR